MKGEQQKDAAWERATLLPGSFSAARMANRAVRILTVSLALASLVPVVLLAQTPRPAHRKISPDASASSSSRVQVIIQYKQEPGQDQEDAIALSGGTLLRKLHSIHAHAATVPQSQLEKLAADPNVRYISLDRPLAARATTMNGAEYTTEPINAPQVWAQGYNGTGIGVAVIDSGIQNHPDLQGGLGWQQPALRFSGGTPTALQAGTRGPGRVVWEQNFVPNGGGNVNSNAGDSFGHGTHVAGLIGGNGSQSTGLLFYRTFKGAAPNVNLIDLRALDANGAGTDSQVIAAIEQAIALKSYFNIRVINLSLGRPIWESYTLDPLCQAVEQAWKAGIVVVVAAGNNGRDLNLNAEGYGTTEAPGNAPYVITVGAMNTMETASIKDDIIASYSS